MREQYENYASSLDENFYLLFKKINSLKEESTNNDQKLKEFENMLTELLYKENQAIESNDFEEAQKLENSFINTKQIIEETKKTIKLNQKEVIFLREQEVIYVKTYININENFSKQIANQIASHNEEIDCITNRKLLKNNVDFNEIMKFKDQMDLRKDELSSESNVSNF